MSRRTKQLAIAALSTLTAASAHASVIMQSGDEVDGWRIAFPNNFTVVDEQQATAVIDVTSDLTNSSALSLNFIQANYNASPTITINEFSIDNGTASPLDAVNLNLSTLLPGTGAGTATYANQAFNLVSPTQNIFTTQTVSANQIHFAGTLAPSQTASFGANTGSNAGEITINGQPSKSGLKADFNVVLNSQQGSGGNTTPPGSGQPIISLSSGSSAPSAYGALLATPFTSNGGSNGSYAGRTVSFEAASKGFLEVNGFFNPTTDSEAIFLDVQINGVQATAAQIASLVADINSPNTYGDDATIAYNALADGGLPISDPFGSQYNLLIDLPTGYLATHNLTQPVYYGIDLTQDPTVGGSATIVGAAIVPEPAQLGLLALGSIGIFSLLGRRRKATA